MRRNRNLSVSMLLILVAACGGSPPAPEVAANPPVDRAAVVRTELEQIEVGTTWVAPAEGTEPTRGEEAQSEPPTRSGSNVGQEFAQGVGALAGRDPCEDLLAAGDEQGYSECRRNLQAEPCRDDYPGHRDPCWGMTGQEEQTCVQAAKDEFCNCLRQHGVNGGGC